MIETLRVTLPQLQPLPSAIEQWECFKRLAVNVLDEVQEFFPTPVQKISTAQQFDSTTLSSTLQDELETIGRPPPHPGVVGGHPSSTVLAGNSAAYLLPPVQYLKPTGNTYGRPEGSGRTIL